MPRRQAPAPSTVSSNGHSPSNATLEPPRGKVRVPELAIGLFVMVAFALGAVLWHLNSVSKVPALAVSSSVKRGDTVRASDLRVVYIGSEDRVARLDESQSSEVVGRVALVDMPAGTLITRDFVADATNLKRGDGVVGLSLEPGQYPATGLAPGDRVDVVRSPEDGGGSVESAVIVRDATVYAVEDLGSDRQLVSIKAGQDDAEAVAAAAGGSLRLVLVQP